MLAFGAAGLALHLPPAAAAHAQTDYYNTDRGRPVQIEDAYATERYAFELKLAPVKVEWTGGETSWGIEPEIAYGLLPRTHLELGVPIAFIGGEAGTRRDGMAGVELSLMHNFNTETRTLPALGLRADVLAPVGPLAPDGMYATFTGMLTRTFRWMRVHVNGQVTVGDEPKLGTPIPSIGSAAIEDPNVNAVELSRWLAGIAIDKAFPLSSVLLTGELYGRRPLVRTSDDGELFAGTGVRLQASPTLALDLGVGRRVDSSEGPWYVTFGTAYAFGVRSLMPGGRR
ncbi:MAG TPA: hypothetical protein VFS59_16800 [Gemmatimonadaceae bacterium]|nr:hypothetical protein [Gemmatimonadaceae bacterium]